ncbi:MAG TPA: serine/threonine-protein kinase [Anaeromyxobacteraceae bacterium]|nr:serine/threonine-protein kinase [Anaeromyxobacteraceae bacterium]
MKDPIPFGRYLLLERVDVGGMAEVFLARGPDGEACAVKRLLPGLEEDPAVLGMFLDEARLTALLSHPGIVAVRDFGRAAGGPYMVMEYVPGVDLGAVLRREGERGRRLPPAISAFVAREVALALDHAHQRRDREGRPLGIVHRDVSPRNVLLAFSGAVKLIDFGIARAAKARSGEEGVLRGKVSYMSPEQASGGPVDPRSDVFALGAVLHEMLAGARLFRGDTDLEVLERIRRADVAAPSASNAEVPGGLDAAVLRALDRDPARRFETAGALALALAPFADARGAGAVAAHLAASFPAEREAEHRRLERVG